MLTVAEARTKILAAATPAVANMQVPLQQAHGRILAADVLAPIQVPPCDNSAMDGYAVRVADLLAGPLPVAGAIYAGAAPGELLVGTAQRIFTGAPLPAGADAVVIQEDVQRNGDTIALLDGAKVVAGDNIRRAGEDIRVGEQVLVAGRRLQAADIGLLASLGIAAVAVRSPLRVGLLCTGDELLEPGDPPQPGRIYNSNRYLLVAMLGSLGCEVVDAGIVGDDLAATCTALQQLAQGVDVLVSTGGVSVGDADVVKQAVESLGGLDVWKIAVKPGKPLAFGHVCGKPFFGLPGNPVSAFVTLLLFVQPFLQRAQGGDVRDPVCVPVKAGFAWPKAGKREEYLRVTLQREGEALVAIRLPNQGSGVLSSVARADALLRVPVGTTFVLGDVVECLLLP